MNEINCSRIGTRLGRFYDGELDAEEAARVERHLRHCHSCSRNLKALHRIDRMLHVGLPDGGIARSLSEKLGRPGASSWWIKAVAAAVLPFALGIIGGGLLFNGHVESRPRVSKTASLIEESFGPGSLHGFDDLARDLEPRGGSDQ